MSQKRYQDFVFAIEPFQRGSVQHMLLSLNTMKGKHLKNLSLNDLILPRSMGKGQGVYLLKKEETTLFVGRAVTMSFLERIPRLLDTRVTAEYNNLLVYLCEHEFGKPFSPGLAQTTVDLVMEEYRLVLIPLQEPQYARKLERLLRIALAPLNGYRTLDVDAQKELQWVLMD